MTSTLTVVVVGHVDHGKTSLVRALTGMRTDRLREEVERGMSITLGFAWRDYPPGVIDLVDAPGHEDFIRAMVAGATGASAVLLVVSASEGFGRQTWEHLQIAGLLGIAAGVVAVAKADLITAAAEAEVRAEIAAALAGTVLAAAPIVFCSSVSGRGLEELHLCLAALSAGSPPPERLAGAFLPIDRAFTLAGAGTIVTGTLRGGGLRAGGEAILLPSGRPVGLRRIQAHGADVDECAPGGRVAVGLRGVSVGEARAGEVLCAPGAFAATTQVDVLVTVAAESARPLKHLDELRVLWGARRDVASARLIGVKAIAPGESGLAQLRFATAVVAFAGQRAVLRRLSPPETFAGALVLDPAAAPLRGKPVARRGVLEAVLTGDAGRIAAELASGAGGVVSAAEVARLSRLSEADARSLLSDAFEALDSDHLGARTTIAAARLAYLDALAQAHGLTPARAAVSVGAIRGALTGHDLGGHVSGDLVAHVERRLAADGSIRLAGSLVASSGHDPLALLSAAQLARLERIEADLAGGGVNPPDPARLTEQDAGDVDLLKLLVDTGRAVSLRNVALRQTVVFHRDALRAAHASLRAAFPRGVAFATGEARAALGTSRKFIVPLLEYFDAIGLTARDGDRRGIVDTA